MGNQVLRSGIRIAFAGGIRDCEKQIIAQRGLVGALRADASLRRARNQQNRQTAHTLRSLNQHVCVPKIRFYSNGDEVRRGRAQI